MKKFLLPLLLLIACKGPKPAESAHEASCPELDRLFHQMDAAKEMLGRDPFQAEASQSLLDSISGGLKANLSEGKTECSFVNQQAHPGKVRFDFIEPLSKRIAGGELESGLGNLLQLRELFSGDKEIQEYFGEELAWIAKTAPAVYLNWFNAHPDQNEKLFSATRWAVLDKEKIESALSALEGGKELAERIRGMN